LIDEHVVGLGIVVLGEIELVIDFDHVKLVVEDDSVRAEERLTKDESPSVFLSHFFDQRLAFSMVRVVQVAVGWDLDLR
jgi:hypothetical protein